MEHQIEVALERGQSGESIQTELNNRKTNRKSRDNQRTLLVESLTMNPLYQALICCFVKFVFSMRKLRSSFGSFLLPAPPIADAGGGGMWGTGRRAAGTSNGTDIQRHWFLHTAQ